MAIDILIYGSLVLFALVKYEQHTLELATIKRWKFINFIKKIEQDTTYTDEFKTTIRGMLVDSTNRFLLPRLVIFAFRLLLTKNYGNVKKDFNVEILKSKKEHQSFKKAVALLIEINFFRAPHWYVFLAIFWIIFLFFTKLTSFIKKEFLETVFYGSNHKQNHRII